MKTQITQMSIRDYDAVVALWESVDGIGLDLEDADSRAGVRSYLRRNRGMSFVARQGNKLVGAVLCGHDGRRGYLHHLAVAPDCRRKGIGRALVGRCLVALRAAGIRRCHIFVFGGNLKAQRFWERIGWGGFRDLRIMSTNIPASAVRS